MRLVEGSAYTYEFDEQEQAQGFCVSLALAAYGQRQIGWVPVDGNAPDRDAIYVVELVTAQSFQLLAYADSFSRVFAVDAPVDRPPARFPDVELLAYEEGRSENSLTGCVQVYDGDEPREVARFAFADGFYHLFDTWYDFGPHAGPLSNHELLTRAFAAFCLVPRESGVRIPTRGLAIVDEYVDGKQVVSSLRGLMDFIRTAQGVSFLQPPQLAIMFATWLNGNNVPWLEGVKKIDDRLLLVDTARYANMLYLAERGEGEPLDKHGVWGTEAALNRLRLLRERFGDDAWAATRQDIMCWDRYHTDMAGAQLPDTTLASLDVPDDGGEWAVLCRLAAACEHARLPYRVEVDARVSLQDGVAVLLLTVPDIYLSPRFGAQGVRSQQERSQQVRAYALHVALMLASVLFEGSERLAAVQVRAVPLFQVIEGKGRPPLGEFPEEGHCFFHVQLLRDDWYATQGFHAYRQGDPLPLLDYLRQRWQPAEEDALAAAERLPGMKRNAQLPEYADKDLDAQAARALGAVAARDLRITHDGGRRQLAERLADQIVQAESATQAMHLVRQQQEESRNQGDDLAVSCCTRLMTALAEGSLDVHEQNQVVSAFLGEDTCSAALVRAKQLVETDSDKAASILLEGISQTAALNGFVDGATVAYRSFDSYVSRVMYNLAAQGQDSPLAALLDGPVQECAELSLFGAARADAGKRLEIVPDSYYVAHLEAARLLERSFNRAEEAIACAKRAVRMAPATTVGYRTLGRAYMLVGDMDSAVAVLKEGLRFAFDPENIALGYYQLAYALWKTGDAEAGAACYLKSTMDTPIVALQAAAELRELVDESSIKPLPRQQVDLRLKELGIPLAPSSVVLDALDQAMAQAADQGLTSCARSLLSLRLLHRSDDALTDVRRFLGDKR